MKKTLFYVWALLALLLCGTTMTSCSDDDDKVSEEAQEGLVGTWQTVATGGYEIYQGEREDFYDDYDGLTFVFKGDGTGQYMDKYYPEDNCSLTWKVSGDQLYVTLEGEETESATISTLTSNTLKIEYREPDYYEWIEYKRIK